MSDPVNEKDKGRWLMTCSLRGPKRSIRKLLVLYCHVHDRAKPLHHKFHERSRYFEVWDIRGNAVVGGWRGAKEKITSLLS